MSPPTLESSSGVTILIVDDDPDFREFVRIVLERHGYRVLEASNAPAGLALDARRAARFGAAGRHDVL